MTDQDEADRRTGLSRVLEAIEEVADLVDAARVEIAELAERVDRLEGVLDPSPVLAEVVTVRGILEEAVAPLDEPEPEPEPEPVVVEPDPEPQPASGPDPEMLRLVTRVVAASHRRLMAEVSGLLDEAVVKVIDASRAVSADGDDTTAGELLSDLALDVESIRRTLERVATGVPAEPARPAPSLDPARARRKRPAAEPEPSNDDG